MTQEQFEILGIEKEIARKAAEESKKELKGFIAKTEYDTVKQQCAQMETSVNTYKSQLDALKAAAGDNETLKQQIADLQAQNQQKDEEHKKELDELKMTNAIKMAIASNAQDSDIVAGLVDRTKLLLSDEGKVTGLEEQLKALRESKPFLFKQEQKHDGKKGFFPLGPKENEGNRGDGHMTMKEAIAAKLNLSQEGKGE